MSEGKEAATVPDLLLERYRLGELAEAEMEALRRRLQSDEGLRRRLEALDRSDQEIERRYPAGWLAGRVDARVSGRTAARGKAAWTLRWPVPVALAAAATLVLVLTPRLASPPVVAPVAPGASAGPPADRIKGLEPALSLFRKTATGSESLGDGDHARRGDLVRLGYRAAGRRYGVILSVDGRGAVTLHLPPRGGQAALLQSGGVVLLDHAYELDDAPRWERFFFVTSDAAFDSASVVGAARKAAASPGRRAPETLDLPSPLGQCGFSLEKETTP